MSRDTPDRLFFGLVIALSLLGFLVFLSASLGLLSRQGVSFQLVAGKQLAALLISLAGAMFFSKVNYRHWQKASLGIFILAILLSLLVFIPGIGLASGGARRWISLGPWSFQPSEFLKLGTLIYLAAFLTRAKEAVRTWRRGVLPFLAILALAGGILVAEPDIDTLAILFLAGLTMFFVAGAKWRHLLLILILLATGFFFLAKNTPYLATRLETFLRPSIEQVLGPAYQLNQSLIAIGSGGWWGRGFGQSLQKFKYLPEPIGDSIFSVAGEEFGFIGSGIIVLAFLALALAGLKIASRTQETFGRLLTSGIVIMMVTGAFLNIAAMVGLAPTIGTTLLFISHGGTALFFALAAAGIILNISRHLPRQS